MIRFVVLGSEHDIRRWCKEQHRLARSEVVGIHPQNGGLHARGYNLRGCEIIRLPSWNPASPQARRDAAFNLLLTGAASDVEQALRIAQCPAEDP